MRVIVTGGTGFIGPKLCERLVAKGHDVIALTRDASRSRDHVHPRVRVVSWAEGAAWEGFVDGAGALVNLAGETIAQRWTAAAKTRILESRLRAAARLKAAAEKATQKPGVLVNASAVGIYGPRGDEMLDEGAPRAAISSRGSASSGRPPRAPSSPSACASPILRTGLVLGSRRAARSRRCSRRSRRSSAGRSAAGGSGCPGFTGRTSWSSTSSRSRTPPPPVP